MSSRILVAVIATLALTSGLAQADVWRWKDAQNKWHYSDLPVEGAELIKSTARIPPQQAPAASPAAENTSSGGIPASLSPSERLTASGGAASDRVAATAATRAVQADLDKKRAEQCKEATTRYDQSITARRLYREAKNGERVFLNDAQITQARVDARTDRDAACGASKR